MTRSSKDAEEDEACRDGGVEYAQEDNGGYHEGKCNLLVDFVLQTSKRGRCHVLSAGVSIYNATDQAEHDDFANGDRPERLGEILGVLHLSDEARKRNLSDERIADVHECAHAKYKGKIRRGRSVYLRFAQARISCGLLLDSREDGCEDDGDEGEEGRECGKLGESRERAW